MNALERIVITEASVLPLTILASAAEVVAKLSDNPFFEKCVETAAKTTHISVGILSLFSVSLFFGSQLPFIVGAATLLVALPLPILGAITGDQNIQNLSNFIASTAKAANVVASLFILPGWSDALGILRSGKIGEYATYLAGLAVVVLSVLPSFINSSKDFSSFAE